MTKQLKLVRDWLPSSRGAEGRRQNYSEDSPSFGCMWWLDCILAIRDLRARSLYVCFKKDSELRRILNISAVSLANAENLPICLR